MSYDGPIIDAFFHPGWAATTPETFGDRDSWIDDPMRARVMRTFGQGGDKPNTSEATMEQTVAEMDKLNITHAIFQASLYYQATRPELEARVKEHADIIAEYPGRFSHSGCVLPPRQGPASYWDLLENPRILDEHKEQYGITGVHLLPSPWGTPPNDKWFYPLYAKCVELDLVVYSYIGMPGPLWPTYPNYPLHLDDVAIAFPDLKIVGHHVGDPWVEMMTHLAAKHPNLYITTSAWSPKTYPEPLLRFMRGKWHGQAGADKVIFGTDYPLLNLTKAVTDARNLDLPEDVLEKFLYSNAAKLHGIS
ncbi:amidohydrolase family protein [Streptomyces sp. CA-100214]